MCVGAGATHAWCVWRQENRANHFFDGFGKHGTGCGGAAERELALAVRPSMHAHYAVLLQWHCACVAVCRPLLHFMWRLAKIRLHFCVLCFVFRVGRDLMTATTHVMRQYSSIACGAGFWACRMSTHAPFCVVQLQDNAKTRKCPAGRPPVSCAAPATHASSNM